MKKIKITPAKPVTSVHPVKSGSRFQIAAALVILLLTAITGTATLHFSLAATNSGDIYVDIVDSTTGQPVKGINVAINIENSQAQPCKNMTNRSDANGYAGFFECSPYPSAIYFLDSLDLASNGYRIDPSSSKKPGATTGQLTTATGWQSHSSVTVIPIDTDGDGVRDNTDQCANAAGPSGNYGCPVVVAPPAPAPTVTTPTPPKTSATTSTATPGQAAKPATSSVKKPTTITSKPSTATPTPAVVTATSGDTSPPSAPSDLTIDLNDTTNFLSWVDSSDNVAVAGYDIERSTDQKQWDPIAQKTTDTFYTDQDLTAGKHYYYRVRALDAAGNLSEGAMADIAIPKSNVKKAITPDVKKTSSSGAVPVVAGILLLAIAAFTAFWLFRRHSQASNDEYSHDVALPPPPAPNATVYAPDQPAEHTSVSLRDMVVEDMRDHPVPPKPPRPPLPPVPPAPPAS